MAFKNSIAELLAYRSAYICNNPECNTLTVGAELNDPALKLKIGEAAHIIGEKPGAARYKSCQMANQISLIMASGCAPTATR